MSILLLLEHTTRLFQSFRPEAANLDSREAGHPLAVLVVEPGRRGDREGPAGREPKHAGTAAALPQSPRGWRRVVAEALRRRRRRGSHLRRLPPESCGHLQETGPRGRQ